MNTYKKFGLYLLVLGLVLIGGFTTSVSKIKAVLNITVASAKITGPHQLTIVFNTGGDNLTAAPVIAYGPANDGADALTLTSDAGVDHRTITDTTSYPNAAFTAVYTFDGVAASVNDTGSIAINNPSVITDAGGDVFTGITVVPVTDGQGPILAASNIFVNNSVQPNKVILTFSEPLAPGPAEQNGDYIVTNGTIIYSIDTAVLSSSNVVTLTLAPVNPADNKTFITNNDFNTGIRVTPNPGITDTATPANPYAGGLVTANVYGTYDGTPATVTGTLVRTNATTYKVTFSEKLDLTTSQTLNKYTLGGTCVATSGHPPAVSAVLQANGVDVVLTTPDTSGCAGGQTVIVTPANTITDVAGWPITSSATTYTFTLLAQSGSPELTAGTPPTYGTQLTVGPGTLGVQTNLTYTWYRSADAAIGGDTSLGTGTTYTPVSADIGNYLIVIATTPDAAGDGSLIAGTTVVKATPTATLTVSNSSQTYSGSGQAATVGITAFSTPGAVASILTGGAATQTNVATYAVTANFVPTDTTNYNTLTALSAGNFVINKVGTTGSFTVAPSKTYDGGVTVSTLTQVVDDKIGLDDVSLTGGVATYADPNADTGITVSLAGATLTGGAAGNYNLTTVTDITADITKIQLTHTTPTITLSKTYDGDTTAAITAAGTLSGVIGSEDVTVTEVATYDNKDVGTGKTITVVYTLSGADQGNYLKPVDNTTTVTGVIARRSSSSGGGYMPPAFLPSINIISTPVVVDPIIPKLPKTGFPPQEKSTMFPIVALAGVSAISIFLYFFTRKNRRKSGRSGEETVYSLSVNTMSLSE